MCVRMCVRHSFREGRRCCKVKRAFDGRQPRKVDGPRHNPLFPLASDRLWRKGRERENDRGHKAPASEARRRRQEEDKGGKHHASKPRWKTKQDCSRAMARGWGKLGGRAARGAQRQRRRPVMRPRSLSRCCSRERERGGGGEKGQRKRHTNRPLHKVLLVRFPSAAFFLLFRRFCAALVQTPP